MADKKPKDQQAQDVTQTEGAPKPADELAQLREILFGQTNRAFRADLSALESRVNDSFSKLNTILIISLTIYVSLLTNRSQNYRISWPVLTTTTVTCKSNFKTPLTNCKVNWR